MPQHNGRRTDDAGTELHERRTDTDPIARIGGVLDRYKIFWVIFISLLAWWSKTVMVPLQESARTTAEVRMINKKIDEKIIPRLDSADADRAKVIRIQEMQGSILGVLTRLQCLRTSAVDRAKIDLNCRDIPIEVTN